MLELISLNHLSENSDQDQKANSNIEMADFSKVFEAFVTFTNSDEEEGHSKPDATGEIKQMTEEESKDPPDKSLEKQIPEVDPNSAQVKISDPSETSVPCFNESPDKGVPAELPPSDTINPMAPPIRPRRGEENEDARNILSQEPVIMEIPADGIEPLQCTRQDPGGC